MTRLPLAAALSLALAAPAAADERPALTVYTYDSFVSDWGPGPLVEAAFEKTCGCDLVFVAAGDGAALLGRVRLEGESTGADVVLGLDTSLTAEAAATGLFAPHGLGPIEADIPGGWADATFAPYDFGWFAFVYDETRTKSPPRSFEALLSAPASLKIVIQDPRTSTPGLGLLLWVKTLYGDRAGEVWATLAPRILTVTKGWSEAYGMFLEGEADMVLSYTTSPAYHLIAEEDATKKAARFDEGHYMQIETAAMMAATKNPDLARAFLSFMLSDEVQSIIPTTNWMYPAVTPADGLPEGFETLIRPEPSLLIPAAEVPAQRREALEEWLEALSR